MYIYIYNNIYIYRERDRELNNIYVCVDLHQFLHKVNEKSRKHKLTYNYPLYNICHYTIHTYTFISSKLAAVAPVHSSSRCTSLVCSCYVPARNSADRKDEESIRASTTAASAGTGESSSRKYEDGSVVLERRLNCDHDHKYSRTSSNRKNCSNNNNNNDDDDDDPIIITPPLKSNLKKATSIKRDDQLRKVSWPDSLGRDIAHVREFEPSVSEDGELKSVRNSCICAIQ